MAKSNILPLARERRLEILAELDKQGAVRVTALAEQFGVAEETIRRDLDKLNDEGRLARTHGGALSVRHERTDLPLAIRRNNRATEKRLIAQRALSHLEPNDVVALDASTTVLEMACLLPDMPLTVVTYGLDAAHILIDRPQIQVISTGGQLDPQSVCFLGPLAEAAIRQFSIDKVFCSCKGIDLERGLTEAAISHASIKRLLMQRADRTYLLADHSKFGVRSMAFSGELSSVDVLVTDEQTDPSFLETFHNAGVLTDTASSRTRSTTEAAG